MANTEPRMLRLLSLLQTHRHWAGPELARRMDVSLRTLRRDVDRLRELGYPVDAQRGVEGGYQLAAGAALPPLVLDDEEAVALAVGLLDAAQGPIAGTAESSVRALTKIISVMPKRLRSRVEAMRLMTESPTWNRPGPGIDSDLLTAVAQACRDSERIEFGYTAADGAGTDRLAEPHRLVSVRRRWYLVAYDLGRHDWRSFRLDRMDSPRMTGAAFAPRRLPAADAAEFVQAGLVRAARPYLVEAIVAAPGDVIRERIGGWAEVDDGAGPSCTVRIHTDDLNWAIMALTVADAEFQVQGPPEFAERLREASGRFTRAAGGLPDSGPPRPA